MFDLAGKRILVTGAGGLLGKSIVRRLIELQATVVPTDIGELDVLSQSEWELACLKFQPDSLIHCAALTNNTRAGGESDLDRWNEILDVNLTGAYIGCTKTIPGMVERGGGSIVLLGSLYASQSPHHNIYGGGVEQPIAYTVAKHGILGLTRYLAAKYAKDGVRVNCLSPGGVYNGQDATFVRRFSELCPIGRMATPDEVCGAVAFLVSDESKYMTGQELVVDGGWSAW